MRSLDLPHSRAHLKRTYDFRAVRHGRSSAIVYRLERDGHPSLFLKVVSQAHAGLLRDEAERLSWLHGRIPVPEPLDFSNDTNGAYLLTAAVPGEALTAFNESDDNLKRRTTALFAEGLRMLHEVDAPGCPFGHSVQEELSRVEASSIVDEAGNRRTLLLELRSAQPYVEEQEPVPSGLPQLTGRNVQVDPFDALFISAKQNRRSMYGYWTCRWWTFQRTAASKVG